MTVTDMFDSHLIVVCGHYGSGKTNVAVNLALAFADKVGGDKVCLVDMDTVNPYFRSADSKDLLKEKNIRLIASEFANTNVDIPSLPAQIYSVFPLLHDGGYAVLDVGGDATGSAALGFIADRITEYGYEMLFVANMYRPLTDTAEECFEILDEIQRASGLTCTRIVNNSNIGASTSADDISASLDYQHRLERICGLPTAFISTQTDYTSNNDTVFLMKNVTKRIF